MSDTSRRGNPDHQDEASKLSGRRDFMARAAFWTTASALVLAGIGTARMPMPGVLPGASKAVKIGPPGNFPVSNEPVPVPGHNFFVLHDDAGFAAVSAVCTHLGCIVSTAADGFECPCHGSRFAADGRVTRSPAGSALPWYLLTLATDGQIVVHTNKTVPAETRHAFA
jgi:Rieske Fe-S protein